MNTDAAGAQCFVVIVRLPKGGCIMASDANNAANARPMLTHEGVRKLEEELESLKEPKNLPETEETHQKVQEGGK